jgi:hypothetical protein
LSERTRDTKTQKDEKCVPSSKWASTNRYKKKIFNLGLDLMKEKEKNQELLKKLDRTKEEAKKGKILIPIEIVYYVIKFLHQAGEKFAYINFEDNDFLSLELYDQTYSYDASGV